jgi:hypothetical protein
MARRIGEQKVTTLEPARPAGVEPQQTLLSVSDYLRKLGREINDGFRAFRTGHNDHDQDKSDAVVNWLGK